MKHLNFLLPACLALLVCGLQSCAPCCTDPEIVKIPATDGTAPVLHWEVSVLTETPSGPISSMTMYSDPTTNISVKKTDAVNVYLVARDNESGVKKMKMQGGFGYICTPSGGGIALAVDGIIPERSVVFNRLTTCGLKEWKISIEALNVAFNCPGDGSLSSAGIGITGSGENFKGGMSNLTLNIGVTE